MRIRNALLSATAALGFIGAASAQAQAFTAKDISGRWESVAPVFDEVNKFFTSSVFELYANQWTVNFIASADAAGQQKLFSLRVGASNYTLGKPAPGVANAVEGDFDRGSVFVTAYAQPMADMFKQANCGDGDWKLGVEQDVTVKGCAFIPSKTSCPKELDIVVFDGKTLSFGDRSGNMCALPRPTKASKVSLVKRSVHAMIQAKVNDPGAFFGQYVPGHVPSVAQYGGKFAIELKTEKPLVDSKLQGTLPGQLFIIQEWPSLLAFNAWWSSPEYAPWNAIRSKAADVQLTLATAIVH